MPTSGFKLDTRDFERTLREYRRISKRTNEEIVNTKAYFIARRALVETYKADKGRLKASLLDKRGQEILGKLINARRGKRGEKGLYGEAMIEAQALIRASRLRAVGFLKSGWVSVIKNLAPYVKSKRGAVRMDNTAKVVGRPKGDATPAKPGIITRAIIRNFATSKHTTTPDPLGLYGEPALQKAINIEAASMVEYMERKLKDAAKEVGIKTH